MLGLPEKLFIFGGDGERDNKPGDGDDSKQPDADGDKDDKDENKGEPGDPGADDKSDGSKSGDKDSGLSLEEQLDAERRRNLQIQRDLDAEKEKSAKAETDVDVAKERDKEKTRADKLQGILDKNFLGWSIERNKKYEWADPADIPLYIKPDEIRIDLDKEEIEGLDLALKRIAKEKPHLLKPKEDDQDDDAGHHSSGSHPRGGKTDQGETEDEAIRLKFKLPGFGAQAVRPL